MSAKLLYNLSDENPNLNRQFGCMNGIFQVFYRQHYPVKPVTVSRDVDKSAGERRDISGEEVNMETVKSTKKKKKKERGSSESSSRLSFSSSPRSSSFSSAEVSSTTASQFEQPGEEPNGKMVMPYDLKELVKGSINRDMAVKFKESHRHSYDGVKTGSKLKETPRLSLDSRTNTADLVETVKTTSHRRLNSSVVAKLMGLEVIEDNFETEKRKENRFCDSPRPMVVQRSKSVDAMKKIPASKCPMEPAPWKKMTVYGEIQKRLTQLEFKKSGKDLRALKQILEAMDGSRRERTPVINFRPVVVAPVSTSRKTRSGKQNAMDLTPRPGRLDSTKSNNSPKALRSRQADSVRSPQQSVSPRTPPKKIGLERKSRPTSPKPELGNKIRRQQTESASSRRKQAIKQSDDRLSNASSDLRSLRSDSNISLGSNVDIEVTSKQRLERLHDFPELHTPKQRSPNIGMKQDIPSSLRSLKVTVDQPSPVSVLDAAFDEEDSPSPVRKISLTFKDDDAGESEWINKPNGVCRSILLPENNLKCFPEQGADVKSYISEILLASGLLRDLEYSMITIQLNQARLPINPELFFILEQNKASNMVPMNNKRRGFRQQPQTTTSPTETIIKRKLVFDTINEILAKRFVAQGYTKPSLTANPIFKGEQLVQTICSEIDRFQENKSKCILEDDEEDMIWEDLQSQGMKLKDFQGETSGIVLDIERMIFRDLVNEVCFC